MIKRISKEDVSSLVKLGESFWNSCIMKNFGNYQKDVVHRNLYSGILTNTLIGWASQKNESIVSGVIFSFDRNFWTDKIQMTEIAWFCEKEQRGSIENFQLIKFAEKYAKQSDVMFLCMARIKGTESYEKLDSFYLKNGYQEIESTYIKLL